MDGWVNRKMVDTWAGGMGGWMMARRSDEWVGKCVGRWWWRRGIKCSPDSLPHKGHCLLLWGCVFRLFLMQVRGGVDQSGCPEKESDLDDDHGGVTTPLCVSSRIWVGIWETLPTSILTGISKMYPETLVTRTSGQ